MWDLGQMAYPSAKPFEKDLVLCPLCLCKDPKMILKADTPLAPALWWHHHFSIFPQCSICTLVQIAQRHRQGRDGQVTRH